MVEGVRHGAERIVASETLLTPGSAYTEAQLREALHRVERLPFVVEADFSLRRGSRRGQYELVVAVTETRPLFLGGSIGVVRRDDAYGFGGSTEGTVLPEVGGRVFFGGYHEISATLKTLVAAGEGWDAVGVASFPFGAEYRHHNLFGRHVVGTLFVRKPDSFDDTREMGAELAFPLNGVSALKLRYEWQRIRWRSCVEPCSLERSRRTTHRAGLSWLRDTTDDPFAPQVGSRLEVAAAYHRGRSRDFFQTTFDPFSPPPQTIDPGQPPRIWLDTGNDHALEASLGGRRYWPVSTGAALGLGVRVAGNHGSGDWARAEKTTAVRTWRSGGPSGTATLDAQLIGRPKRLGRGTTQLWWTVAASAWGSWYRSDIDATPPLGFDRADSRFGTARLSCALAARGRWGIARLELSYEYAFRSHFEYR